MRTAFSERQLADPGVAVAERILRACVHCGFCTATCPTYVLLGDELDSPRGRIYLIKNMLESGEPPTADVVKHVDRCLTCLACMTTCPSGVDYMHLVDLARVRIEEVYRRPPVERVMRWVLTKVLPRPGLFRLSLRMARLGRPLAKLLPKGGESGAGLFDRMRAMLALAPARLPPAGPAAGTVFSAEGERKGRVAILQGCAQQVLSPAINAAATRLLNRHGIEVVLVAGERCCGALAHHMGREDEALASARANVDLWLAEVDKAGLDAVLVTASGCGTTLKDYGHMLRHDAAYAARGARAAALVRDITEYVCDLDLAVKERAERFVVAYHAACSLQHGQKITRQPKELLSKCGFVVKDVPEGHLCCGSAGTYNILQPAIAGRLRARKLANIESVTPDVIAAGNIGCIVQIRDGTEIPVLHTIELADWATGGPPPNSRLAAGGSHAG